ncbi:hypothetical protein DSM3645_02553 [Blastopirellula marina DSM 3645]|uniref:Uncharacterized protein n=1 Tax=Blastopirellula marina DSM 3645 TaxID=314230 RepID=A3ZVH4_9BACT|nr:hypothetical protein DSM3645_02553 [Blastopirellula marina DSM 3645]
MLTFRLVQLRFRGGLGHGVSLVCSFCIFGD